VYVILTDIERSRCSHLNHALEVDMVATVSRAWENTVGGRRSSKDEKDDDWENECDGTIANEH